MEIVGKLTLAIGGLIVSYILHGLALASLWAWFIVPTFDKPAINMVQAIGISIIMGLLTRQYIKQEYSWEEWTGVSLGFPLIAWLIGWIVHLFL